MNSNESVAGLTSTISGSGSATVNVEPGKTLTVAPAAGTANFAGTLNLAAGTNTPNTGGTFGKSGAGTEALTGAVQLGDGAALNVSDGTLRVNASGGTVGAGVTANVSGTGTLELAGAYSALGNDDGRQPHGDQQQQHGRDRPARLQRQSASRRDRRQRQRASHAADWPTASLTADHITAGSLVIGGDATSSAVVTIAASNSDGTPMASVGFALAGSLASNPSDAGEAPSASSLSAAGDLSPAGGDPGAISQAALDAGGTASAVPEPSAILLMIFGGLAFLPWLLRRQAAA